MFGSRRTAGIVLCALLLCVARAALATPASYVRLRVEGVINPVKVRLVERALSRARLAHAEFLLVELDTPGGQVSSMNEIVAALSNASTPIVTYVSPRSAEAASAGSFIALAGAVAAMAPGTRIGAAHPIAENGKAIEGPLNDKLTNNLSSLIRSLAERRGRPAEPAEAMVRSSASYTAEQAHEQKLVELLVANEGALLAALDGRKLSEHTLHTQGLERIDVRPTLFESLVDHLAEPTLTSLFISFGVLALLYELATPGVGASGAVGGVLLVLGLMGASVLPIELSALALLVIGVAALALEVKLPTHGVLGGAGVLALAFGGLLLVDRADYFGAVQRGNPWLFLPLLLVFAGFFLFAARNTRAAMAQPPLTGVERLVGRAGKARSTFGGSAAAQGFVYVDGARWLAESVDGEEIEIGRQVTIVEVTTKPLRVRVRRVN